MSKRIGNLEFRNKEIIRWYPNYHYGKEDKYYIKDGEYYIVPDYPHCKVHESLFKDPEFYITLVKFCPTETGQYYINFVGDIYAEGIEPKIFNELLMYGYNKLEGNHEVN